MILEPISINIESLNLASLLPTGILVAGALLIICLDLIKASLPRWFFSLTALAFLALSFFSLLSYQGALRGFFDLILLDGISILSGLIILVVSGFFILFSLSKQGFHDTLMAEFYALYLFMSAGFMAMALTDNLILIFVGLETGSLALYALIAMHNRLKSIEAALKYFTMGALASGIFALSALLFYAQTGSLTLGEIGEVLLKRELSPLFGIIAGAILLLVALGFKLSLVPFHTWTPDAYEGASSQMAGYMSIVPKIAAFVVVMRFFEMLSNLGIVWVDVMLYIVAVLTMSLANIMALVQKDIKRMLAFSSISHAGFLLSAILVGTDFANGAFFVYWVMFAFANLGAFGVLWISRHKQPLWHERYEHPYEKFAGLIKTHPAIALVMGVFMVSLAGIPPFSLFWGKLFLLSSAINSGYIVLAVIMAVNSAIALYYYLKVVVFMFLREQTSTLKLYNNSKAMSFILGFLGILCLSAFLYVEPLLQGISYYLSLGGF